ncbi:hypothetical protein EAH79_07505 [Sphingomonas koreensis]|nr:hypothetical protein EAH79_07505 [Sphingomonas koreensis]
MIKRLLLMIATVALMPELAHAAPCRGYDVSAAQSGAASYDPASVADMRIQLTLMTRSTALDASCSSANISVAPRDGSRIRLTNGGDRLDGDIVRASDVGIGSPALFRLTEAGRGRLVRNGRLTIDLLQISSGQFTGPGDYTVDLDVVVGDRPAVPVQLLVHVDPAIRFVGEAASGLKTLSLGDLERGANVSSAFLFKTNAAITVTARSEHGGNLQHELGASFGEIPYAGYYSGERLDLKNARPITVRLSRAGLQQGDLRVVVLPQHGRYAGAYRDVLTLDFTAF